MSQIQEQLAAIAELQHATNELQEAVAEINGHNTNTASHMDIREMLTTLLNAETVYTKDQILAIVDQGLKVHTETEFQLAHPGWDEYETEVNGKFMELDGRLASVEAFISGGGSTGALTVLEEEIQKIEDKYAPILDNLQTALTQARDEGKPDLVEEYKKAIEKTLEEKNAEIMQVIEEYSS